MPEEPVSLTRMPHGREGLPLSTVVFIIFLIGVASAIVFLAVAAPILGYDKVNKFFDRSVDINQLLKDLNGGRTPIKTIAGTVCGNTVCEPGETISNCLQDCFVCNHNGQCEAALGENQNSCPQDCTVCNNNGTCDAAENAQNCPADCQVCNNNGTCETNHGENTTNCPNDCPATPNSRCGDGICNGSETCSSCSSDCGICPPVCGNGNCETGENPSNCPADCSTVCTNGQTKPCSISNEFGSCSGTQTCSNQAWGACSAQTPALDVCHDGVDNNCDGQTDEDCVCSSYSSQFACNWDARKVGHCLWFNGVCNTLPEYCPIVFADENKNIVVDGKQFFPVGFWAFYYDPNPLEYKNNFISITDDAQEEFDFVENTVNEGKIKLFSQSGAKVQNGSIVPDRVQSFQNGKNVLGWEVQHEPNEWAIFQDGSWHYTELYGDVPQYAQVIRNADACKRFVFITPTITGATSEYLQYHNQFVDLAVVQAGYGLPALPLSITGTNFGIGAANAGTKPAALAMNINAYTSQRLRVFEGERSQDEIRAQAFDSVIHSAKGIFFYSFSKGIAQSWRKNGVQEPNDAIFNVTALPTYYDKLKTVSLELQRYSKPFASLPSASVSVNSGSPEINCDVREAREGSNNYAYVFCVNVADDPSPYLEGLSGDEIIRLKAQLFNDSGQLAPGYECSDDVDNDLDGTVDHSSIYSQIADSDCSSPTDDNESAPGWVYQIFDYQLSTNATGLVDLSIGITWENRSLDKVKLFIKSAPLGAQIRFAVFSDSDRDFDPDTKLVETPWTSIPFAGEGDYQFNLPNAVTIEHTRKYYLLIQVSKPVTFHARDMRYGVRFKAPFSGDFPASFQPLHRGKNLNTTLQFNKTFSNCQVSKDPSGNFSPCTGFSGNQITDSFAPYGVNIYKLSG